MFQEDTICAPATPPVNSTLGIIRISGPDSLRAVHSAFSHPARITARTAVFGTIIDNGKKIDDVILIYYPTPKSYTGEDMVEIICHGNQIIVHRILRLLLDKGLRIAEPGEFSRRSFLNGKIDLTEAEAINHVIRASSEWEVDTALKQMHGSLRDAINAIKENVTDLKGDIEAGIDFIDQEIEFISYDAARERAGHMYHLLDDLLGRCRLGERISHGIDIVITGKPNVGKSSMLNYILNQERAIVSDIPGTTRDIIKEPVQINGIQINLMDTAGINQSDDKIEQLGVELSRKKVQTASIILLVIDASTGIESADRKIIESVRDKKTVYIINKIDIADEKKIATIEKDLGRDVVHFSALKGTGLKDLEYKLADMLGSEFLDINNTFIADLRVINILEQAIQNIKTIIGLIEVKEPVEFIAFELQSLIDILSEITGEISPEDVLNSIFSKFCIGK